MITQLIHSSLELHTEYPYIQDPRIEGVRLCTSHGMNWQRFQVRLRLHGGLVHFAGGACSASDGGLPGHIVLGLKISQLWPWVETRSLETVERKSVSEDSGFMEFGMNRLRHSYR